MRRLICEGLRARLWILLPVFLAGAFLIYGGALGNGFVLDDESQIVGNAAIQDWRRIPGLLFTSTNFQAGAEGLSGIYYKPVMTVAYAALWAVNGRDEGVFHGAQIALFALAGFLAFLFFTRIARPEIALALALLWLAHPLNAEIAIYAADLQDVLYVVFGLGALLVVSREGAWTWARGAALAALLLLSLLSKESGILFTVACVAWIVALKARRERRAALAACALAFAAYAVMRFGVAGMWSTVGNSWARMGHATIGERLLTLPMIVAHYAFTFVWPERLVVAQDWIVSEASLRAFWAPLALMVALAAALVVDVRALSVRDGRPDRRALVFAIWLIAALALHAQILPLDGTVADRWFAVPMLALFGLTALSLERIEWRTRGRARNATSVALAFILLGAAAARSYARVPDWRDGYTLYAHDVELDPDNGLLQNNLGVELHRRGKAREALARFEIAVRLSPYWTIPWNNFGAALEGFGRDAEAEDAYRTSVQRGVYDLAFESYPRLLLKRGKRAEARAFIENIGLRALPRNRALLALQAELARDPRPSGP